MLPFGVASAPEAVAAGMAVCLFFKDQAGEGRGRQPSRAKKIS